MVKLHRLVAMFDRFSQQARLAVGLAFGEARRLGNTWLGTEHLLAGLLWLRDDQAAVAPRLLDPFDLSRRGRSGDRPAPAWTDVSVQYTPRARLVLQRSVHFAAYMGQDFVGSEHLLLGILSSPGGPGEHTLREHGVKFEEVKARVLDARSTEEPPEGPFSPFFPMTTSMLRAHESAIQMATGASRSEVNTGDYLLALFGEAEGVAGRALRASGVTFEALAQAIRAVNLLETTDIPDVVADTVPKLGEAVPVPIEKLEAALDQLRRQLPPDSAVAVRREGKNAWIRVAKGLDGRDHLREVLDESKGPEF